LPVSQEVLDEIALSQKEYQLIVEKLGREPNQVELGLFGALWSEHCGYKHSKSLLKQLPSKGKYVIVKPGQENAGVVDIGNNVAIVFKIESHNHPSAIEPHQGAATGVGGIIRDIISQGCTPIALLDSIRFGNLESNHSKNLFENVVRGISTYGNCVGIPNAGGEAEFSEPFENNCLVNVMCVGIVKRDKVVRSIASTSGNFMVLYGARTGRDGIQGVSFASKDLDDNDRTQVYWYRDKSQAHLTGSTENSRISLCI